MSITKVLNRAGLTVVSRDQIEKLKEAADLLYVDARRERQVTALEQVREIARKL